MGFGFSFGLGLSLGFSSGSSRSSARPLLALFMCAASIIGQEPALGLHRVRINWRAAQMDTRAQSRAEN